MDTTEQNIEIICSTSQTSFLQYKIFMKTKVTAVFVLIFMDIFFLVMKLSDYFNDPLHQFLFSGLYKGHVIFSLYSPREERDQDNKITGRNKPGTKLHRPATCMKRKRLQKPWMLLRKSTVHGNYVH